MGRWAAGGTPSPTTTGILEYDRILAADHAGCPEGDGCVAMEVMEGVVWLAVFTEGAAVQR